MKFKPNYMLTFNVMITEFCVALLPMLIVLTLIEKTKEPMLPLVLGWLFITFVFFTFINLLNIVTIPFSKPNVYTTKYMFYHRDKQFYYNEIKEIEIEKGLVGRYSKGEPFTIILRKSPSELTFVENPSVILVLLFLFKCKNAKIKIKKWYTVFIWMLVFPLMVLLIFLIAYFSNK